MSTASPVSFKRKTPLSPVLNADSVTPRTAGFAEAMKIAAMRKGYAMPKSLAEEMNELSYALVTDELLAGRHVNLRDFGTFKLVIRNRKGGGKVLRVRFLSSPSFKAKLAERRA